VNSKVKMSVIHRLASYVDESKSSDENIWHTWVFLPYLQCCNVTLLFELLECLVVSAYRNAHVLVLRGKESSIA
jgi:hypothetical protein